MNELNTQHLIAHAKRQLGEMAWTILVQNAQIEALLNELQATKKPPEQESTETG